MPRAAWAVLGGALGLVAGAIVTAATLRYQGRLILPGDDDPDPDDGATVDADDPGEDGPGFFAPAR